MHQRLCIDVYKKHYLTVAPMSDCTEIWHCLLRPLTKISYVILPISEEQDAVAEIVTIIIRKV